MKEKRAYLLVKVIYSLSDVTYDLLFTFKQLSFVAIDNTQAIKDPYWKIICYTLSDLEGYLPYKFKQFWYLLMFFLFMPPTCK